MSSSSLRILETQNQPLKKEIKLIFQITKSIQIDSNSTISDIKKNVRQLFGQYTDDFRLLLKENDITNFDNMKAFRTLDYYKSDSILINCIKPKNLTEEFNHSLMKDLNSVSSRYQIKYENKERTNELITSSRRQLREMRSQSEFLNLPESDDLGLANDKIRSDFENERMSQSQYLNPNNNIRNQTFSPNRYNISNINNISQIPLDKEKAVNRSRIYSSSDSMFLQEPRGKVLSQNHSTKDLKSSVYTESQKRINEKFRKYNVQSQMTSNLDKSTSNDNIYSSGMNEKENRLGQDELESLNITNRILNKANLNMKKQIEECSEIKRKESELISRIDELKQQNDVVKHNYNESLKINNELNDKLENLRQENNELLIENKNLINEIEILNNNIQSYEKMTEDFKDQVDFVEENKKSIENERNNLLIEISNKDNTISELDQKIRCLEELNINTKKSCKDYEDMLKGMKKTIEILKKSNDEVDFETSKMKSIQFNFYDSLQKKSEELENLEKMKNSLEFELDLTKNESIFLTTEISNKEKIILENQNTIRKQITEIEKSKIKYENLLKISDDKDKTLENIKNTMMILNRNLEISKNEVESLKKRLNDEIVEKNRLLRNQDNNYFNNCEFKNQFDELNKTKENLVKQNLALEEDNFEIKNKYFNLKNENENLNSKLVHFNEIIQQAQKEKDQFIIEKSFLENEKNSLNLRINELTSIISKYEINEVSVKTEIENQLNMLNNKERVISNLIGSKDELHNEIFNLNEIIKDLKMDKNKLIEEKESKMNEIQFLESKFQRDKEKHLLDIRTKENLIENLNKSINEISSKLNELTFVKDNEYIILENQLEDLKREISQRKENEKNLQIDNEDIANQLKYSKKTIENLEKRNENLIEENSSIKKNCDKIGLLNREYLEKIEELHLKLENTGYQLNINDINFRSNIKNEDSQISVNNFHSNNTPMKNYFSVSNEQIRSPNKNLVANSEFEISQENLKIYGSNNVKDHAKIEIKDGPKFFFTIFDKKRILRFDLENKIFKLIEFADFGDFTMNFVKNSSSFLTLEVGLFVLTGENCDQFYFYSPLKHSMIKLNKLNSTHNEGSLLYINKINSIYCLGGKNSSKVEKYVNNDILKNKNTNLSKTFELLQTKNTWINLPSLNDDKVGSVYYVFENNFIYSFFGFSSSKNKNLDYIERMNIESHNQWEIISVNSKPKFNSFLKGYYLLKQQNSSLILFGGFDELGHQDILKFNQKEHSFENIENKFSKLENNSYKHSSNYVCFEDVNNNYYVSIFDENQNNHLFNFTSMRNEVYNLFE